jgi:hypothetical protein
MDTKTIVMKRLGISKLGKKGRHEGYDDNGKKMHCFLGDEIAMEVMRVNGQVDFVLGRYDHKDKVYRVAYDPNMGAGRIKRIENAYSAV